MTSDEALRVAREVWRGRAVGADEGHVIARVQAALLAAVAEEREACAAIAETLQSPPGNDLLRLTTGDHEAAGKAIAAAIRARQE